MSATPNPAIDLPLQGVAALDASAGTGKTYSIALLHLRLILTGTEVDRILVSTFTNDAAAELRERLRERLLQAREILTSGPLEASGNPPAAEGWPTTDGGCRPGIGPRRDDNLRAVVEAAATRHDPATLHARVDAALSCFDLAPICTIHSFCQRLVRDYALELGADPDADMQATDPAIPDIVADFHAALLMRGAWPNRPGFDRDALTLAHAYRNLSSSATDAVSGTDAPAGWSRWQDQVQTALEQLGSTWATEQGQADAALLDAQARNWLTDKWITKTKINHNRNQIETILALAATKDNAPLDYDQLDALESEISKATFLRLCRTEIEAQFLPATAAEARTLLAPYRLFDCGQQLRDLFQRRSDYERAAQYAPLIERLAAAQPWRVLTFADLIQAVHARLADPSFVAAVRADFDAVLVDECQDTDPQQIAIFKQLFAAEDFAGQPGHCLVWVGDPKQSIYRFRGADVDTYLFARAAARDYTLDTNFRSDPPLVAAVNALFRGPRHDGSGVFDDRIQFDPVQAYPAVRLRLPAAADAAPPAFCCHTWPAGDPPPNKRTALQTALTDCAAQIEALLNANVEVVVPDRANGGGTHWRRVQPGDIAVLGRTHPELEMLRRYLLRRRIPAAYQTDASVYHEPEARDLSLLLGALAQPRPAAVRTALTTPFFGYPLPDVAQWKDGADFAEPIRQFAQWAQQVEQEGILAVLFSILRATVSDDQPGPALVRLAGEPGGERTLTNIIQLGELLQDAWREQHARRAEALKDILDHAIAAAQAGSDTADTETTRLRLETDRPTVILSTIHASKGLQYPIVFLPSIWLERAAHPDGPPCIATYNPQGDPTLHRPDDDHWPATLATENQKLHAEQMRLLYVALTRAKHQVHVWWGPAKLTPRYFRAPETSAFARLLGTVNREAPLTDSTVRDAVAAALQREAGATGAVYNAYEIPDWCQSGGVDSDDQATAVADHQTDHEALQAAPWSRPPLPGGPYQASYSALIRKAQEGYKGEDEWVEEEAPDTTEITEETVGQEAATVADNGVLMGWQAGRLLGDRIHCAFEDAFQQPDADRGRARFVAALARDLPALALSTEPGEPVSDPLRTAQQLWRHAAGAQLWPAGPALETLFQAPHAPEWTYLLPQSPSFTPAALLTVLRDHGGNSVWGDPFYHEHVARLDFAVGSGFFEGIIDLLGQLPDGRWVLVDYKTNWVESGYATAALHAAMSHVHYLLQALLYSVALQRWLRHAQAGWDYDRDFAGTAYLFLRGLQPGTAHGVWFQRPPQALVDATEACLCGKREDVAESTPRS